MGAWGVNLFDDDFACDIKEDYINRLKIGKTNQEATKELLAENSYVINDSDISSVFWFALADTQWNYGRLIEEVRVEALKCIDTGEDLKYWEEDEKLYNLRKKVLSKLEKKLKSPQPIERKITKISMNRTPYTVGDVLLYQIKDEVDLSYIERTEEKYIGKYVLLCVVGIKRFNIGYLPVEEYYHEETILGLFNWIGKEPIDPEKIQKLFLVTDRYTKNEPLNFGLSLTKRRSKKMEIELLMNLDDVKNNKYRVSGTFLHDKNLDYYILNNLKEAEKKNTLVKEF